MCSSKALGSGSRLVKRLEVGGGMCAGGGVAEAGGGGKVESLGGCIAHDSCVLLSDPQILASSSFSCFGVDLCCIATQIKMLKIQFKTSRMCHAVSRFRNPDFSSDQRSI